MSSMQTKDHKTPLVLTLVRQGRARTLTFDGAARSLLWICPGSLESAREALAVVELDGAWPSLRPALGFELHDASGARIDEASLDDASPRVFSIVSARDGSVATLYVRSSTPGSRRFRKLGLAHDADLVIGRDANCAICYGSPFVSGRHARLSLVGDAFEVEDLGSSNATFVNGRAIAPHAVTALVPGDVVQVMDLSLMVGHRFFVINDPDGLALGDVDGLAPIDHASFARACPPASSTLGELASFYPAPRLMHSIHSRAFTVDEPPAAKKPDDQPAFMQLGPSFLMGFASVFMLASAVSRIQSGTDPMSVAPTIAMSVSMIAGTAIWPVVSKRYQKRLDARNELRRESSYGDYLNSVEATLSDECAVQAQILRENRMPVGQVVSDALALAPTLMNRSAAQDDFMDLRVGTGVTDLEADVRWPQRRFSVDDDRLMDKVDALRKNPPIVSDVPLAFNPVKHPVAGVLGRRDEVWAFVRGLLAQVCGMFGYQDVKLVIVASADEASQWDFLRSVPHVFDDAGVTRMVATDVEGLVDVSMRLERVLGARLDASNVKGPDFLPYYLVVCADKMLSERSEAIGHLAKLRDNRGFSLLFLGTQLRDLPRECGYVIDLSGDDGLVSPGGSLELGQTGALRAQRRGEGRALMFDRNDVSGTIERFEPDIELDAATAARTAHALARVRLDMPSQRARIPESLGFLEMFEVGNTAQLNIAQRWAENDASRTLQTPVGRDAQGEWSMLNLHENVHGPHGLIAGTTGSGKSEFIITYILSMCVNYPPDQVAFVLIDYKGGGLAGAFDNDRHVLPHLAGTITNLDGAAITRSLVSIKSELKRRQDLFNKARDITGEATVDIYKYLSYYRQGVLTEPLPHLFIVADEFAELKAQEPEFMDELISAARIGRSLGVHLILATQKPTGVVNDQIWSNSRFKVCLKVADAADSKEMIRRPDAAEIKRPGRFYLLVGFNEYFACGQSAYSGARYAPQEAYEPRRDNAVELVGDTGEAIASARPAPRVAASRESELNAVLDRVCETADAQGRRAGRLWLNPLPSRIYLGDLERRYARPSGEGTLSAVVGEIDDPSNQRQSLYEIDLAKAGNVLLYGGQSSGVDGLAATMLYSLAEAYGPEDLGLYIADLGAGSLAAFDALPQCGGVVLSGDDERMTNLIKLLESQMDSRRRALASEGGGIEAYNRGKHGSQRMPHIVFLLANLAAFYELYDGLEDRLNAICRDAPRYGMHVVLTASAAMVPHMRLRANFSQSVVTSLNDPSDYTTLLGSMQGVVAPHGERRGIAVFGKRKLEFQGATIGDSGESEGQAVADLAARLCDATELRCAPIPVLPDRVIPAFMPPVASPAQVPVGFSKAGVAPVGFDLARSPYMLVLGNDADGIARYLRGVREQLSAAAAAGVLTYWVIDPQHLLGEVDDDRVVQGEAGCVAVLEGIEKRARPCDVLVFTSVAQTVASLPPDASRNLTDYLASERGVDSTKVVAASELWRIRGIYDPWMKVLSAYGNGVWVGSGFADQSTFRFSRSLPEYRQPAARSDGFLAVRGAVEPVRLLEATDEPIDNKGGKERA